MPNRSATRKQQLVGWCWCRSTAFGCHTVFLGDVHTFRNKVQLLKVRSSSVQDLREKPSPWEERLKGNMFVVLCYVGSSEAIQHLVFIHMLDALVPMSSCRQFGFR